MTDPTGASWRYPLSRVIAVVNGKGGVGKTSITAHLAGLLASMGMRILVVDFDRQGNLGDDFGYNALGHSDGGAGLANAVLFGGSPLVLKDVRANLDVMPGGLDIQPKSDVTPGPDDQGSRNYIEELSAALGARASVGKDGHLSATLALAQALLPYAGAYDVVFIDCPPALEPLQRAALGAARYALIPTKTDLSSLKGLAAVANRYGEVLSVNPDLQLLGVVLFGVTTAAKIAQASARSWVEAALGEQAPVFKQVIRHVESIAQKCRDRGQLATELVLGPETGATPAEARGAAGLAKDYATLVKQVNGRLIELETAAAAGAVVEA